MRLLDGVQGSRVVLVHLRFNNLFSYSLDRGLGLTPGHLQSTHVNFNYNNNTCTVPGTNIIRNIVIVT